MDYGASDTSTTSLGINQFPISEVYVANTGLKALGGGPKQTDASNKDYAPVLVYTQDGSDVTLGTSTDPNTANTVMGRLTKIKDTLLATLTVSGTLTANIGTTGGLALDTSINGVIVAQGSTTSGQKGTMVQGAVTTGAPTYTTGQTSPLSLTQAGALRVDNSANTQPVSGTVTVQQSIAANLKVDLSGTGANATALKVDGSAVTQPVSGTFWQATQPISGTVTANAGTGTFPNQQSNVQADYDTSAGTQNVTMMGVALPASGGAVAGGTSTNPLRVDPTGVTTQPVSGTVSITANSSVNVAQVGGTTTDTNSGNKSAGTQRVVIATDQPQLTNALKVDGSGVTQPVSGTFWQATQPVSGTITANAGTGPFPIAGMVASGASNANNPVKTGGVFNTTQPTVTNGQIVDAQYSARGAAVVATGTDTFNVTVNAALPTGSNVIGHVVSDSGSTTAVTQATAASLNAQVQGAAASGATQSGNPVKTGGVFNTTQPTVTNGQAVDAQMTARGAQIVATGADTFSVTANAGTNLNTSALALESGGNLAGILTQVTNHAVTQGAGAAAGTSWRTVGDFTEQASLSAGALNADLVVATDVSMYKSLSLQINGNAYSGTLTFQWSNDNINFYPLIMNRMDNLGSVPTTTTSLTAVGFCVNVFFHYFRVRMTSYTSGTAQGTLDLFTFPMAFQPVVAQGGTWTVQPGNTANTTPWVVKPHDGTNPLFLAAAALADGASNPTIGGIQDFSMRFNGTSWDRARNNVNTTTGDSGTKTATFAGAAQTNYDARGAMITALLGTISGTSPTMTMTLQWSPDGGTTWLNYGSASPATVLASNNTIAYLVYPTNTSTAGASPGALTFGSTLQNQINAPLPRTWRINYTIGGTTPSIAISSVQVNYIL